MNADQRIEHFFNNHHLHNLDLSNLNLTQLPKSFYHSILKSPTHAARIKLINLANNRLSTLPLFLKSLPNLQILFLLSNSFTTIPDVIRHLPALYMLSFKNNSLTGQISGSALPPNISWLILTSNQITSLSQNFPNKASKIRKLMLSNNALSQLPSTFPIHMRQLELLRLANNRFQTFPDTLLNLPHLAWLSLAGNPCTGPLITNHLQLPHQFHIPSIEHQYQIQWQSPLGSGTSGVAYPAVHKTSQRKVAVKKFKTPTGSDGRSLDEISITLSLPPIPGVVQPIGYSLDKDSQQFILVTQLVPGNPRSLARPPDFQTCTRSVYDQALQFDERDAKIICDTVENAVKALLHSGVAHADVYAHNVLVGNRAPDGSLPVVLADFGAAWRVDKIHAQGVREIEMRALAVFQKEIWDRVKR